MRRILSCCMLWSLMLAACGAATAPTGESINAPTAIPPTLPATSAPTAVPSTTLLPTAVPTATPLPTAVPTATQTATPLPTAVPTTVPSTTSVPASPQPSASDSESAKAVAAAVNALAQDKNIAPEAITVLDVEETRWNDSSLGCPQPDISYMQVITPGYKVTLEAQGKRYIYHTDTRGTAVTCK